ncbi:leucine-rich repeat-containing protein 24-like [Contarinia nasturtii]|uniref:leucine-rich repeat-containing protein 24-like n=1 Tax=Contarinia nasturtii TaxID=265458 RepID=UPI0012D3CDB5|nr:leucine-rich repeat-containing protein 24-like [Contarinia nasturtii]
MQTYQIIVLLLFVASQATSDDWTSSCPTNCTCKWTNGKKSVICNALQLTAIPTTLSTEVQVLVLNENDIVTLNSEEFTTLGLVNLQRIYLKKSGVTSVHRDAFKNLKILVEIDLSENSIETLDKNTFNGNDRLRILYLNGNPLKMLMAYQFPVLPHLRSLDLHNCQINSIDPLAFANLELLELLNLKNNLLENLVEPVFQYMQKLKTLQLEGNPWRCDCHLRHFRNWYVKNHEKSASLRCTNPMALRTKIWSSIDESQFGCQPTVDVYSEDIFNVDIGSNVTLSCLIYGDPLPTVAWELNGRDIINDNVLTEDETIGNKLWRNITILNITNYDAGIYVCSARNDIGSASRNISIYLTEIVQHVIEKGPETFWYFGLILGTFGTVFCLITISFLVCLCKKTTRRRRSIKNIKGSVSFNDQEKKLLDLSITTNDRQDSGEVANTPSVAKQEPVIALEPVQITIENLSRNEEFPMNVGVFTPPPEFCSNVSNPAYGNIFISVQLTQDVIDNPEQMYPDLLNIPNRVIGKLFPINVSSYATLPRNRHQRTGSLGSGNGNSTSGNGTCSGASSRNQSSTADSKNTRLQNVINYQNLDTTTHHLTENGSIGLCTSCLKKQDNGKTTIVYPTKYDNMGRRITASGNSILSIPDEEKESAIDCVNISSDMTSVSASCVSSGIDSSGASTSRAAIISGSIGPNTGCSSKNMCSASNVTSGLVGSTVATTAIVTNPNTNGSTNIKSNSKLSDRDSRVADDKMRDAQGTLLLPTGCDYVSL